MEMHYDPSVDMFYIDLRDAEVVNSDEIQEGLVADYDEDGNIVANGKGSDAVGDDSDRILWRSAV